MLIFIPAALHGGYYCNRYIKCHIPKVKGVNKVINSKEIENRSRISKLFNPCATFLKVNFSVYIFLSLWVSKAQGKKYVQMHYSRVRKSLFFSDPEVTAKTHKKLPHVILTREGSSGGTGWTVAQ